MAEKKRKRRKRTGADEETPAPRDPLLNYKKPQLVERYRAAQQRVQELQQQLALSADAAMSVKRILRNSRLK